MSRNNDMSNTTYIKANGALWEVSSDRTLKCIGNPPDTNISLFRFFILILLCISVFRVVLGGNQLFFTTLLEQLSTAPSVSTSWIKVVETNFHDSFVTGFKWLGSIFDFFTDLFSVAMFTSTALLNVCLFFVWFLRWLFLV